jgi:hypothetical protein
MRILIAILVTVSLTGCFDKGPRAKVIKTIYKNVTTTATTSDPDPAAGTLLSWGCDGYTRLNEIADGQGGSSTEEIERSPDCGWNPPEAGTVSEERCEDPYTLVTVFHDGEYGFYEEEDENNEECGYEPPVIEAVKESGDRFDPVVFAYSPGSVKPLIEVTLGTASVEDDKILIFGSGEFGEGTMLVGDEEYRYTIAEEPRCAMRSDFLDCQYYKYTGRTTGYIYYGEDDDRVVEWEIALVIGQGAPESFQEPEVTFVTPESDPDLWDAMQYRIDKYNQAYEMSGVHVRFTLVAVLEAEFSGLQGLNEAGKYVEADVVLGFNSTCDGACGCAPANKRFPENAITTTVIGTSVCGVYTDLHEIGHAVGLAHGPQNGANEAVGYIWREFGHGWASINCGYYADIMSYNATRITHHNSTLSCEEVFGTERESIGVMELDWPSGDRDYADSAYHLNRVRYDVSLIYTEGVTEASREQSDIIVTEDPEMEVIVDRVDQFDNGLEMIEQDRRVMQSLLTKEK